jgi:glutamate transport system permease protein
MSQVLYDYPGPKARRRSRLISVIGVIVIVVGVAGLIVFLAAPRTNANGAQIPGMLDPSRWDLVLDRAFWRTIGRGLLGTLRMAGAAAGLALIVGVLFSMARTAGSRWVRVPATVLLEFFRGMPVLLLMLFILLIGGTGAYWAGVIGLALYNGAIIGEALRAGIAALPRGQRESGLAIGLTPLQTRFQIEFPQAFRQMLPIIIAQLVVLLKDTSLAYTIGYMELLNVGLRQGQTTFGSKYLFTLFFVVLVVYLGVNLLLSTIARIVAKRTAGGRRGRGGRFTAQLGGGGFVTATDVGADSTRLPDAGMGGGGAGPTP